MNPTQQNSASAPRCGALVFDFDGTLVDSSDIKERAFLEAIRTSIAATPADLQRAYRIYGTLNRVPQLSHAFEELMGRPPDSSELDTMLAEYGSAVLARSHEVHPFEGMIDFLADHRTRYYLAVASNAPESELSVTCSRLGISDFMDLVLGYPTTKLDAIVCVARTYSLDRSKIIYIGDRPEDAKIADRAGVPFCRFGPLEPDTDPTVLRTVDALAEAIAGATQR